MMLGARFWVLCQRPRPSLLMSPHDGRGWKPQEIEKDGRPWIEISMESHNGIYAARNMEHLQASVMTDKAKACLRKKWWESDLREYDPRAVVFGFVRIWGKVIEHQRGYRAEYATVHSLDTISYGPEFTSLLAGGGWLEILRLIYGVSTTDWSS
jgi:hypothetical protein